MRKLGYFFILATLITGSVVEASSYLKTSGTIVDPILDTSFSTHPYMGPNLEPGALLSSANLTDAHLTNAALYNADLSGATLSGATLTYANLWDADLAHANLTSADLTFTIMVGADLTDVTLIDADLTNAHLTSANLTGATFSAGTMLMDNQTVLQHGFDELDLQTYLVGTLNAYDASNLTIVIPEPSSALLLCLGLTVLAAGRRNHCWYQGR
jgi:hypothetical protein